MSSFNLTRIVTMSPFYTLVNKSSYELEVGEVPDQEGFVDGKWHYISSTEVTVMGMGCLGAVAVESFSFIKGRGQISSFQNVCYSKTCVCDSCDSYALCSSACPCGQRPPQGSCVSE